ncbi:hypothetical protein L0657_08790 [Dyadobacter sp. CY345]|uniref:hypothetical protein n=1 Tax=Dyadobacter sp. CY345 TaxID=2909335 RepID=UPI001F3F0D6B|nr:hypothetical protein [Dyadobacter sp. CY345]MCF2444050.1 hypothetical protein [Dyadobacter sp. CY345]
MKTNSETLHVIENLLQRYAQEIEASSAKPLTKKIYIKNTQNFVRWIAGDFHPGKGVQANRKGR